MLQIQQIHSLSNNKKSWEGGVFTNENTVAVDFAKNKSDRQVLSNNKHERKGLPVALKQTLSKYDIEEMTDLDTFARTKIDLEDLEDSFYVLDLGVVHQRWNTWRSLMPRVQPYYAVKCNPDSGLLALMEALGSSFDCATAKEIDDIKQFGTDLSKRVVFANPCKLPSHIRHAKAVNADLTTFDTVSELEKIKTLYPECRLLLRIRADDPTARCQLGNKYGAELADVPELIKAARELELKLVGVAFHVGSGATNPEAFRIGISLARQVYDLAQAEGFNMTHLDIGGGFSDPDHLNGREGLAPVAAAVNEALTKYFPDPSFQIMAEPGRFFPELAATLITYVYGKRVRVNKEGAKEMDYWVSDGLYGSMNCVLYDHAVLTARPLGPPPAPDEPKKEYQSTVFGPTCDGLDTVLREVALPEMQNGDWLVFPGMGAYTMGAASDFNGFNATRVKTYYVWSNS